MTGDLRGDGGAEAVSGARLPAVRPEAERYNVVGEIKFRGKAKLQTSIKNIFNHGWTQINTDEDNHQDAETRRIVNIRFTICDLRSNGWAEAVRD